MAFKGDPLICTTNGIFRVNDENSSPNQITVKAGVEIAVASVIAWENTGWRKTCGDFAKFVPEKASKYIVVNERIGGKGVSALWTGVKYQHCEVSVYKETAAGFERIATRFSSANRCHVTD